MRKRRYLVLAILPAVAAAQPAPFNYGEALQKSIYFYDVQRSGKLPANNRVSWRGDSGLKDGADQGVDLTGGWYDAGDHVKFGFPMAGSATLLAWGMIEYRRAFVSSRQLEPALDNLRWATDYFLKASDTPNQLWGQVGSGSIDHAWWGPAEVLPMRRPAYRIDPGCPGSDLAGETSAALAASSLVFRAAGETAYAERLLQRARELFAFADTYRGSYSDCIVDAAAFYKSWSGYMDELLWSALWLYRATGENAYLAKANQFYPSIAGQFHWTHNWDDKAYGSYVLLTQLTAGRMGRSDSEGFLDFWTIGFNGKRVRYTPGGLAWLDEWAPLRYAANTAFLAFVYSDWLEANNLDPEKRDRYRGFAERQIDYILGRNPRQSSYMIGFGPNPPRNPHHRTAHGSWTNNIASPRDSVHTPYGALVGGPDASDSYIDTRDNFLTNEIATDYNAGFTGALARMFDLFGGAPLPNFPVPETPTRDEIFVEAAVNAQGPNFTEIAAYINNRSAWPARALNAASLRYFFTLDSENISDLTITTAFNQCGPISGPTQWEGQVYYVETNCNGTVIAPAGQSESRKQTQFRIASRGAWNPANDWSFLGVATNPSAPATVARIVLYEGGVRVWGEEPPGGPPRVFAITTDPTLPAGTVGVRYEAILKAGGGLPPYREWAVISGQLPDGITLDAATGVLSGMPVAAGRSGFLVKLTDAGGTSATLSMSLTIVAPPPVAVVTTTLPPGGVGAAYRQSLFASGGVPPYTWALTEGALPAGLSLDPTGLISGVPSEAGSTTLTFTVTAAAGGSASRALNFTVDQAPPPPAAGALQVQYRATITSATSNQISPHFRIVNQTGSAIPLNQLSVRYYFTIDGERPLKFWCDWAAAGCDRVVATFTSPGDGLTYAEIGFAPDLAQQLEPGKMLEVQSRISKDDWTNFIQTDDFSFNASMTNYQSWENMPLYLRGQLVWGKEPAFTQRADIPGLAPARKRRR